MLHSERTEEHATGIKQKVEEMISLQDEINSLINPAWREAGNEWYRAVWVECAELMDQIGWKWWKRQELDVDQVKLKLIDIWHFALSQMISSRNGPSEYIDDIEKHAAVLLPTDKRVNNSELLNHVEELARIALHERRFSIEAFFKAMSSAKLDIDGLYNFYIGKNVLNKFRQNNGYKQGVYVKTWFEKEDNFWLAEIIQSIPKETENVSGYIQHSLEEMYRKVISM